MAYDYTYHDDETMQKVWRGLRAAGLDDQEIQDAANCVMNQGIVFREPKAPGNDSEVEVVQYEEDKPGILVTYTPPRRRAWGRRPR